MYKPIQPVMTKTWSDKYLKRAEEFLTLTLAFIDRTPVDMLVFEMVPEGVQIRSAGYHLRTNELVETSEVILYIDPVEEFWFKLDDYGDRYVGTFLLPEDY